MGKRDNVIFVGFAGSGKSTVGRQLAVMLGWLFVDTDTRIEVESGRTIARIFQETGEASFRDLEEDTIRSILSERHQVVSTGGGSVLRASNRERMLTNGLVVELQASLDTIVERVKDDPGRPLFQGDVREKAAALMQARKDAYRFADMHLDTDGKTPELLAAAVLHAFQNWEEDEST